MHYDMFDILDIVISRNPNMNRNIFSAWYCLAVLGLWLLAYFCLLPFVGPMRAQAAFSLISLFAFLPIFWFVLFRHEPNDERDKSFLQRALHNGISNGFLTSITVVFSLWIAFMVGDIQTVSIYFLWLPTLCGIAVALLTFSVVLLLFYYKGENADKEHGF